MLSDDLWGIKSLNCATGIVSCVPVIGHWRVSPNGMKWGPCTSGGCSYSVTGVNTLTPFSNREVS